MFEGNNGDQVARDYIQATALDDANKANAELREALEASKNREAFLSASVTKWATEWQRAKALLEASFEEEGVDTDNLGYSMERLVEMFEIEFTEVVHVTYTVTYSGMVTVKKGTEVSDLECESEPDYDLNVEVDGDTVGNLTLDHAEFEY